MSEGGLDPGSEHLKQRAHCRVIQCETVEASAVRGCPRSVIEPPCWSS